MGKTLVRDGTMRWAVNVQDTRRIECCSNDEKKPLLIAKMREELEEFAEAPSFEEAADMLEVLKRLCFEHGLPWSAVKKARRRKRKARGGFKFGFVMYDREGK